MYPHQCGRVEFLHTSPHVNGGARGERPGYGHCVVETLYESHGILPFGGAQDGKKVFSVLLMIIY